MSMKLYLFHLSEADIDQLICQFYRILFREENIYA